MLDIIYAIENKLRIEFTYNKKKRVVEPYLLGLNKNGDLMLRAYKLSASNSGLKLFKVAEMESIKVTTIKFLFAHPLFKAKDSQILKAMACVS